MIVRKQAAPCDSPSGKYLNRTKSAKSGQMHFEQSSEDFCPLFESSGSLIEKGHDRNETIAG